MVRQFWEDWYEIVEDSSLRQGDIILNLCAFALPQSLPVLRNAPGQNDPLPVEWILGDWIIMSASCDVDRGSEKYPYVLVGRVLEATSDKLGVKEKKLDGVIEVIRRGWDPTKFLLAECPALKPPFPRSFVPFRPHLTLPLDHLVRACVGKRLRLRSPFREWFGSWVGSNFSRVGIAEASQIPPQPGASTETILSLARSSDSAAGAAAPSVSPPRRLRDRLPTWLQELFRLI